MGLMDKVKQQATQLAEKAQEGVQKGQAKVGELQAKRQADALLRDLGAAVYADKTGRGGSATVGETERLLAELRAHEAEHGEIDVRATAGEPPAADGPPA
jgi:hypothetical protein